MGTTRTFLARAVSLVLGWHAACGCGRTELDGILDSDPGVVRTGGVSYGESGRTSGVWTGGTVATPNSTKASGGLASGGYFASGGTKASLSVKATGGRFASGGYVASGGTKNSGATKATGGLTSGGYFASGGTKNSGATKATGGLTSGGYVATGGMVTGGDQGSGGLSIAAGGSLTTGLGGAPTTGGTSAYFSRTSVTSMREGYQCPAAAPSEQDLCECDELPCICTYSSYSASLGYACSDGKYLICVGASATEYGCFGGVWRVIGGGGGSGCSCDDPGRYFGTGGAPSTGGASSTGGTSAVSSMQGDASATGGTHNGTAPTITGSGGTYPCPTTEPYGQQTDCTCGEQPCECNYTYSWVGESSCDAGATCTQNLSFRYICQYGLWQGSGPNWDTQACYCANGP